MAALNYYLGLTRGADGNPENVVAGTSSAGTAVDVEMRMQIDPGTGATGLTREDVITRLRTFELFILGNGQGGNGGNLPAI